MIAIEYNDTATLPSMKCKDRLYYLSFHLEQAIIIIRLEY